MRATKTWFFAAVVFGAMATASALAQTGHGKFIGQFEGTFENDGRSVTLLKPLSYVDPAGRRWDVPAGARTDGASVPQPFWVMYPPFTGRYRDAAVIHDYFCEKKTRAWRETHDMFFFAVLATGESMRTAKVLWAAVYNFGPRWGIGSTKRGPLYDTSPQSQAEFMTAMEKWVAKSNPSREQILNAISEGKIPTR